VSEATLFSLSGCLVFYSHSLQRLYRHNCGTRAGMDCTANNWVYYGFNLTLTHVSSCHLTFLRRDFLYSYFCYLQRKQRKRKRQKRTKMPRDKQTVKGQKHLSRLLHSYNDDLVVAHCSQCRTWSSMTATYLQSAVTLIYDFYEASSATTITAAHSREFPLMIFSWWIRYH